MNNDKLVLKDCTEITLQSSQGMNALRVNVADKAAACVLWEKFSKENLKVKAEPNLTPYSHPMLVGAHTFPRSGVTGHSKVVHGGNR